MKTSPFFFLGISLSLLALANPSSAQDPFAGPSPDPSQDPFASSSNPTDRIPPRHVQCVYEVFSIPKSEAAELERAGHSDQAFYQVLVDATADKKVKQEKLIAIRSRPGVKATVTQGSELIFPTEFEPPEMPNQVGIPLQPVTVEADGKPGPSRAIKELDTGVPSIFPSTPATPSAFDTTLAGDEFEIEAIINGTGAIIDLRFSYACNRLIEMDTWGQGLSETKVPRFSNQSQGSSVTVKSGIPILLGTVSPALEAQDPETPERVWFAFLTSTIIQSSK